MAASSHWSTRGSWVELWLAVPSSQLSTVPFLCACEQLRFQLWLLHCVTSLWGMVPFRARGEGSPCPPRANFFSFFLQRRPVSNSFQQNAWLSMAICLLVTLLSSVRPQSHAPVSFNWTTSLASSFDSLSWLQEFLFFLVWSILSVLFFLRCCKILMKSLWTTMVNYSPSIPNHSRLSSLISHRALVTKCSFFHFSLIWFMHVLWKSLM